MNSKLKILDLSGLSEAERDALVNEAMAHLEGWTDIEHYVDSGSPMERDPSDFWRGKPPGRNQLWSSLRHYTKSADAVLPLLGTYWEVNAGTFGDGHAQVTVEFWGAPKDQHGEGAAPTFPLAACFALLRSHGWTIIT